LGWNFTEAGGLGRSRPEAIDFFVFCWYFDVLIVVIILIWQISHTLFFNYWDENTWSYVFIPVKCSLRSLHSYMI
jgi:hypothetical protein